MPIDPQKEKLYALRDLIQFIPTRRGRRIHRSAVFRWAKYGLRRIAYVDIDAHHGDGMFYAFEADPDLIIADIHEDGRALFPGTGHKNETGKGAAEGTKLNIPLRPRMGDE